MIATRFLSSSKPFFKKSVVNSSLRNSYQRYLKRTTQTTYRQYHVSKKVQSGLGGLNQHIETEINHSNETFEFTEENWKTAQKILSKYPPQYKRSAIGPLLDLAQRQCGGWVPISAMNKVATIVGEPPLAVYEFATFYSMFNRYPVGKYVLHLCSTTPCHTLGMPSISEKIKERLGVGLGEMTEDGKFTIIEVECLGACVNGPVIKVGDDYYEDVTIETAMKLIDDLEADNPPPPGPLYKNRKKAEPETGKTTLLEEPLGPYAPNLDKLGKK